MADNRWTKKLRALLFLVLCEQHPHIGGGGGGGGGLCFPTPKGGGGGGGVET